jgi:excisionase family DNA binding protein
MGMTLDSDLVVWLGKTLLPLLARALLERAEFTAAQASRISDSQTNLPPVFEGMAGTLWTVREGAAFLGVSTTTIYRLVARRELRVQRVGRSLRFDPADVRKTAAGRT